MSLAQPQPLLKCVLADLRAATTAPDRFYLIADKVARLVIAQALGTLQCTLGARGGYRASATGEPGSRPLGDCVLCGASTWNVDRSSHICLNAVLTALPRLAR